MAYLYSVRTKTGREIVLSHTTRYTEAQITIFLQNFRQKVQDAVNAGLHVTRAMVYDELVKDLESKGFQRITYVAIIQLSGDNMDFIIV